MQVPVDSVEAVRELRTRSSLAETVHPHPTLSETLMECAEVFYGYSTHTFARKKILADSRA